MDTLTQVDTLTRMDTLTRAADTAFRAGLHLRVAMCSYQRLHTAAGCAVPRFM